MEPIQKVITNSKYNCKVEEGSIEDLRILGISLPQYKRTRFNKHKITPNNR